MTTSAKLSRVGKFRRGRRSDERLFGRRTPARHNIAFRQTRTGKYSTACPDCNGEGYLSVIIDGKGVQWHCQNCKQGDGEYFEQHDKRNKPTVDFSNLKAVYDYVDESGARLFQVLRFERDTGLKDFRQRTGPDQEKWSIKGVRIVPYRLRELVEDISRGHQVFVVEGEKDADNLRSRGIPATCNPMGAKKWWPEFNRILAGADVVICGDNDEPGRDHVALVACNLRPVVKRLRVLDLASVWPEIEESQDISDWFAAGFKKEQLLALVEGIPDWTPAKGNGHDDSRGTSSARATGGEAEAEEEETPLVTEDLAALEFAALHAGKLLFDHDAGIWFEWAGSHWRKETTGLAFEWARQLARGLSDGKKAGTRYALRKTSFASGVERYARVDRAFAVTAERWDRDPFLLGTPGGTVDLRTGVLRPAEPTEAISKLTSVAPIAEPLCPRFRAFLDEATGGDDALVRFLQQFFGYCLTGSTREHALLFIHGAGGNGKGVLLNTVSRILGDYAATAAMDVFVASRGERHPTDVAMLHGARLVSASEIAKGRAWNENLIKALTGGDPITAHFMRQDNFTFTPAFKLVVIGNHKPQLQSVNEATRRRFNIVPFDRTPASPDPQLDEKLRAEAPGILRWLIDGCMDWQEANQLVRPPSVLEATKDYFAAQDILGQWLEEECDVDPSNNYKKTPISALFASWSNYAKRAGNDPGTKTSLNDELKQHGLTTYRTKAERGFEGIRLTPQLTPRDEQEVTG